MRRRLRAGVRIRSRARPARVREPGRRGDARRARACTRCALRHTRVRACRAHDPGGWRAVTRRGELRVTGGRLRSRRLRAPPGADVRPTADRVREALFARLGDLQGAAVLDLFAGSGALGIEALSRGAESLVCVERSRRCAAVLRANLESLGVAAESRVLESDALRALRRLGAAGERFDLVLIDPPYASDAAGRALAALIETRVLVPGAMVVVESGRCHACPVPRGLERVDQRRYGDTRITRYVAAGGAAAQGGSERE